MVIVAKKKNKKTPGSCSKNLLADVPLVEVTAIIENYNRKHKTNYTYGQLVSLASTGKIKIERI